MGKLYNLKNATSVDDCLIKNLHNKNVKPRTQNT